MLKKNKRQWNEKKSYTIAEQKVSVFERGCGNNLSMEPSSAALYVPCYAKDILSSTFEATLAGEIKGEETLSRNGER